VPSVLSQEYTDAERQRESAKQEITRIQFRMLFVIFLLLQLDGNSDWNWWLVFAPFWFLSLFLCCGSFQHFTNVQKVAAEYLNTPSSTSDTDGDTSSPNTDYGAMEEGTGGNNAGESTPRPPISEADRAEMMSRVSQAGAQALSSCCSQIGILFMLCLIVGKIRGAGYSALWIISPFLFVSSLILCCIGCAIFGVAPVEEGFDDNMNTANAETAENSAMNMDYVPPSTAEEIFIHSPPLASTEVPASAQSDNTGNASTTNQIQKQSVTEQNVKPTTKIDLLDTDNKTTDQSTVDANPTVPISSTTDLNDVQGDIAANGPTPSEVEDLD